MKYLFHLLDTLPSILPHRINFPVFYKDELKECFTVQRSHITMYQLKHKAVFCLAVLWVICTAFCIWLHKHTSHKVTTHTLDISPKCWSSIRPSLQDLASNFRSKSVFLFVSRASFCLSNITIDSSRERYHFTKSSLLWEQNNFHILSSYKVKNINHCPAPTSQVIKLKELRKTLPL